MTELMEQSRTTQGITQAMGVYNVLRQGQCLIIPCQPLVRIAKIPQGPGGMAAADHASVLPIEERLGAVLLVIVERHPLCKVCMRKGCLSQEEQCRPQGTVCRTKCGSLAYL